MTLSFLICFLCCHMQHSPLVLGEFAQTAGCCFGAASSFFEMAVKGYGRGCAVVAALSQVNCF
jgi:hypothetical protein